MELYAPFETKRYATEMTSQNEHDATDNASLLPIKSFETLEKENEEHGRQIKELKDTVVTYVAHLEKENEEQKKRIEELEQKIKTMNEHLSGASSGGVQGHHIMKLDPDTTCWFMTRHPTPAEE